MEVQKLLAQCISRPSPASTTFMHTPEGSLEISVEIYKRKPACKKNGFGEQDLSNLLWGLSLSQVRHVYRSTTERRWRRSSVLPAFKKELVSLQLGGVMC